MLDHLHIQNYRLFQDLEIKDLKRVNLIGGRNNVGKTVLLETLRIYASKGDSGVINNIIYERGDWNENSQLLTYSSLFPNHKVEGEEALFQINDIVFQLTLSDNQKYVQEFIAINEEDFARKKESIISGVKLEKIGFSIGRKDVPNDKGIFIPSNISFDNTEFWKEIELTDKEDKVVKVLQIIEPKIIAVGITNNEARVRLKNIKRPIPLKNFGEGMNRLLTLAIALVNAEDNLLLIDEIEIGLHYSVLEKLWEIIFEVANSLNVQIFATTHSWDCIESFTALASQIKYLGTSNYFRLDRDNEGEVIAVNYPVEELELATKHNIETR